MKIFSTPKKQNRDVLASTQGRFFPRPRRVSQMGTINEMVFHQQLLENNSSIQQLSHFKKNSNKVQFNIQQEGRKDNVKSIRITKKKTMNCQLSNQSFRKSQSEENVQNQKKQKAFSSTSPSGFYKHAKSFTPCDIIKKYNMYPRYKMLELYALYRSILQYAERDPKKFLQGFESALNYHKIMIKPEIIKKNLFDHKRMQFRDFLSIYKKMEDLMFIQSIIDYLQIIFEAHSKQKLKYQLVYQILVKRSSHLDATTITDIIFKKLAIDKDDWVELQEILELCEKDIQFCSTFSRLYHQEVKEIAF